MKIIKSEVKALKTSIYCPEIFLDEDFLII